MFRFEFGENAEEEALEVTSKRTNSLPGKLVQLGESSFVFMGQVVDTSMVLLKRTVQDINYAIAQNDDMNSPNELSRAIQSSSDLIENVYEGGAKTWECSLDLVDYMTLRVPDVQGLCILELGCGSALPGISCLKRGAMVDFQDYNDDVLQFVTAPNVLINTHYHFKDSANEILQIADKSLDEKMDVEEDPTLIQFDENGFFEVEMHMNASKLQSKFYAGDWSLLDMIEPKYDIILSSETVYSAESIPKLLGLIKRVLKPDGVAYIAAKCNYFGCSGSLELFKSQADAYFKLERVFKVEKGVQREILQLIHK